MKRCPKCGYKEGIDWPYVLEVVAFGFLLMVFILTADFAPRGYRLAGLAAFFLFTIAGTWSGIRSARNDREYRKVHPTPVDRVKDHLKPSPSQ